MAIILRSVINIITTIIGNTATATNKENNNINTAYIRLTNNGK